MIYSQNKLITFRHSVEDILGFEILSDSDLMADSRFGYNIFEEILMAKSWIDSKNNKLRNFTINGELREDDNKKLYLEWYAIDDSIRHIH